jgi:hypothetical protein
MTRAGASRRRHHHPKLVEQGFGSRRFAVLYRATWLSAKVATALNNADTPFARTDGNAASLTLRPAARIRKCRTCRRRANTSRVRASSKRQPIPSLRDACTKRLASVMKTPATTRKINNLKDALRSGRRVAGSNLFMQRALEFLVQPIATIRCCVSPQPLLL